MGKAELPITSDLLRSMGINGMSFKDIAVRLGLDLVGFKLSDDPVVHDPALDIFYFKMESDSIPDDCSRILPEYIKNNVGNAWSLVRVKYYDDQRNLIKVSGFGPDPIKLARVK